jgi:hypothetical protein
MTSSEKGAVTLVFLAEGTSGVDFPSLRLSHLLGVVACIVIDGSQH